MFKKFQNLIFILLFLFLIAGPMISWNVLTKFSYKNPQIMESLDFDLNEKRLKATISEPVNLETITFELENYYNDRIPFRSILITLKRNIDKILEEPYIKNIEPILLKKFSNRNK